MINGKPFMLVGGGIKYYSGAYSITVGVSDQALPTAKTLLSSDITVIPFSSIMSLTIQYIEGELSEYYDEIMLDEICDCFFYGYETLTSVAFPEVKTIGYSAFGNCARLTSMSFPKTTIIGSHAFDDCPALTSVSFPNVTTIGPNAFRRCNALINVNFPEATTIDDGAFYQCSALRSVNFPKITTIGSAAFSSCTALVSVNFPEATIIKDYAFSYCSELRVVSFPKATRIDYAFGGCYNLRAIYLLGSSMCVLRNIGGGIPLSLFVPYSLYDDYRSALSDYSYRINVISTRGI